jgi:hypothetical protein
MPNEQPFPFGAPGIEPRWTSSAKEGLGTAYHTSCRIWFTLSHGIVNELYYPTVDQPNTRDLAHPDGRARSLRACRRAGPGPLHRRDGEEYVSLVRSARDGVCFNRIEPAFQRYVVNPVGHSHEMWSPRHPLRRMRQGRVLRLLIAAGATIVWSADNRINTSTLDASRAESLGMWFADLSTDHCPEGASVEFTFFWKETKRWEGENFAVVVGRAA